MKRGRASVASVEGLLPPPSGSRSGTAPPPGAGTGRRWPRGRRDPSSQASRSALSVRSVAAYMLCRVPAMASAFSSSPSRLNQSSNTGILSARAARRTAPGPAAVAPCPPARRSCGPSARRGRESGAGRAPGSPACARHSASRSRVPAGRPCLRPTAAGPLIEFSASSRSRWARCSSSNRAELAHRGAAACLPLGVGRDPRRQLDLQRLLALHRRRSWRSRPACPGSS